MQLRPHALALLALADPATKVAATRALYAQWQADGRPLLALDDVLQPVGSLPGRPARPRLVPAKDVPARSPFTPAGRAALLHAVAHIEFNAIKTFSQLVFHPMEFLNVSRGSEALP